MANNYKSLYSGQEIDSAVKRTVTNANDIKKLDTKIDTHANNQVLDHPDGSVTADKIAVGAVTSDKLGTGAVTSNKLDTSAVIASKIAIGAVTSDKLGTGAVTSNKLGTSAVITSKIAAGAVITSRISDEAVTTEKIADGAATAEKIADESILEKHLSTEVLDRIDGNKFDGTIINTDIDTYEFPEVPQDPQGPSTITRTLIYKIKNAGWLYDFGGILLVEIVYNKYVSNKDPEDFEYALGGVRQIKISTRTGEIHARHATKMTPKKPYAWSDWESAYVTEADLTEVLKGYIKTDDTAGINITGTVETSAVILRSSTEDSTKRFGLTIDDSGAISVQEIEFE